MPNLKIKDNGDARKMALDINELSEAKVDSIVKPVDATNLNGSNVKNKSAIHMPWLYDFAHGWTPQTEARHPRPKLKSPSYYTARFPLKTSGLELSKFDMLGINLRLFPKEAKVFMVLPASIFDRQLIKKLMKHPGRGFPGLDVAPVKSIKLFNRLFGTRYQKSVSFKTVVVEVKSGRRTFITHLDLREEQVNIDVFYGVLRKKLQPKTNYQIHFEQFIDGMIVGTFDHLFNAYHNYDIPIVADKRTGLAYRRSAKEVSDIPPMALAFFDNWHTVAGMGFQAAPRGFGKHLNITHVSSALEKSILNYVNRKSTTATSLAKKITDNPYVNALGENEIPQKKKIGLTLKTSERILKVRDKKTNGKFAKLSQIDKVRGVGLDTLNDIISSFVGLPSGKRDNSQWLPDKEIEKLLSRKGVF